MSGSTWTPTTYWWEDQATCDFTCDTNYTWNGTSCFISTCNFGSTNIWSCNL
jgi:hypothetical protein